MKNMTVATGNSHKTQEIRAMLGDAYDVTDLKSYPELPEVEETGATFLENATLKAVQISEQIGGLVLSDDSGLEVDFLHGAPGVHSARYAGVHGDDTANNAKLLANLEGVESREARFRCVMVLAQNGQVLAHFDGAVEGKIIIEQQGAGGFGYDPLFVPDGYERTFAELGEDVKNGLSHRAQAMQQVVAWLGR
ncbi:MAG TPA: non-canonical purine NTP pyrophosphatase, RdgB/HAM1 family [Verrucomicrobiales bacterium]|jgi:XTP/dITP diphosphohydrolase|nr:non-canonical purine NTP pyrophosphatase, RdgB/HAM1 family [Verrucomicrobiales bacterium]HCI92657.1 non-canonical purine NTP pyrophosphatase, RdgB/HAM1 family [Verrucomicrobiales bacterium]HCL97861.1 non-canonical purine NTP pyrophosphatase, RdgB/HAM1 family [Verrucomicrobiales bacterium]